MLRFQHIADFTQKGLASLGYGENRQLPMPAFEPGPPSTPNQYKASPGSIVFVSVGDGRGLTVDGTFDQRFIRIRAVGIQNDFAGSEKLAWDIDTIYLAVGGNTDIEGVSVLYIARQGGGPVCLERDNGERYHWTCGYLTETALGF